MQQLRGEVPYRVYLFEGADYGVVYQAEVGGYIGRGHVLVVGVMRQALQRRVQEFPVRLYGGQTGVAAHPPEEMLLQYLQDYARQLRAVAAQDAFHIRVEHQVQVVGDEIRRAVGPVQQFTH